MIIHILINIVLAMKIFMYEVPIQIISFVWLTAST